MSSDGGRGKPMGTNTVSRTSKADLQFLVVCIACYHKAGKYDESVGGGGGN
jgi:hypothetical protein